MWTEGVAEVAAGGVVGGFAATGNPVPKGASQLPRPAIIRLSGATISVNAPDLELRAKRGGHHPRYLRHRHLHPRNIAAPSAIDVPFNFV